VTITTAAESTNREPAAFGLANVAVACVTGDSG
jgi:hypothetical protein